MSKEKSLLKAQNRPLRKSDVMPRFYYQITNAFKIGFWAFKNPDSLKESNFKILSDLFGLIMKVANEDRHVIAHLAYIHPDDGEKQIVSIWAGAGIGAEPTKRIAELLKENSMLKAQLSKCVVPQNEA